MIRGVLSGRKLDEYTKRSYIAERLPFARGGSGLLYRAKGPGNRTVILKELFPIVDAEAGILARNKETGIVAIHTGDTNNLKQELGEYILHEIENTNAAKADSGSVFASQPVAVSAPDGDIALFLEMDTAAGNTLREKIARMHGENRLLYLLRCTRELMEVIRSIHDAGLLHLDITPDNIYIQKDGRVTLLDFGGSVKVNELRKCLKKQAEGLNRIYYPSQSENFSAEEVREAYHAAVSLKKLKTSPFPVSSDIRRCEKIRNEYLKYFGPGSDFYSIGAVLFWGITENAMDEYDYEQQVEEALENCAIDVKEGVLTLLNLLLEEDEPDERFERFADGEAQEEIIDTVDALVELIENQPEIKLRKTYIAQVAESVRKAVSHIGGERAPSINETLLPRCLCNGKEYKNLYEMMRDGAAVDKEGGVLLRAEGGTGKTSSLRYCCKNLTKDKQSDALPFYVPVKELDLSKEKPICAYIEEKVLADVELKSFEQFVEISQTHCIIFLDGYNEKESVGGEKFFNKEIFELREKRNITLVVSTRVVPGSVFEDFTEVSVMPLSAQQVSTFLGTKGVTSVALSDDTLEVLSNPMFLKLFSDVYRDADSPDEINQVRVLLGWWEKESAMMTGEQGRYYIETVFPLLALELFLADSGMIIDESDFKTAMEKTKELLKKCGLAEITSDKGFRNDIIDKLAILHRGEGATLLWSHENYAHFLAALGLRVLYETAKEAYKEKFSEFYEKRLNDEKLLTYYDYSDYGGFAVAKFIMQMLMTGENNMLERLDEELFRFIRNVIFAADEYGDAKTVLDNATLLYRHAKENHIDCDAFELANTFSGTSYCLNHILNVENHPKKEFIDEMSSYMMARAREIEEGRLLNCEEYLPLDEILNCGDFSPKTMKACADRIPMAELTDERRKEFMLLSRIYGNIGQRYYVNYAKCTQMHSPMQKCCVETCDGLRCSIRKNLKEALRVGVLGLIVKMGIQDGRNGAYEDRYKDAAAVSYVALSYERYLQGNCAVNEGNLGEAVKRYEESAQFAQWAVQGSAYEATKGRGYVREACGMLGQLIVSGGKEERLRGKAKDIFRKILLCESKAMYIFEKNKQYGEYAAVKYSLQQLIDCYYANKEEYLDMREILLNLLEKNARFQEVNYLSLGSDDDTDLLYYFYNHG